MRACAETSSLWRTSTLISLFVSGLFFFLGGFVVPGWRGGQITGAEGSVFEQAASALFAENVEGIKVTEDEEVVVDIVEVGGGGTKVIRDLEPWINVFEEVEHLVGGGGGRGAETVAWGVGRDAHDVASE